MSSEISECNGNTLIAVLNETTKEQILFFVHDEFVVHPIGPIPEVLFRVPDESRIKGVDTVLRVVPHNTNKTFPTTLSIRIDPHGLKKSFFRDRGVILFEKAKPYPIVEDVVVQFVRYGLHLLFSFGYGAMKIAPFWFRCKGNKNIRNNNEIYPRVFHK